MAESDQYGFMGHLDGDNLTVTDSLGGGERFDATAEREALIDSVADHMRGVARMLAEELVDELEAGHDPHDEDGGD